MEKNKTKIITKIVKDSDAKDLLASRYGFNIDSINGFIIARAIGDSWEKIFNSYHVDEKISLELQMNFKAIRNDKEFKALVSDKKFDLNLISVGVEEQELIERLKSIMSGEPQGKKTMKIIKKDFTTGKMVITEEIIDVDNYPTTSEIIKATETLHKLGFLDAKAKSREKIELDKLNNAKTTLMEEMLKVQEEAGKAEAMAKIKNVTIDESEFIDNNDGYYEENDEEFSSKELGDF